MGDEKEPKMADQLAEMTGMGADEAASFMEMAGGDLESAMGLYFSMMDDGGAAPAPADVPAGLADAPDWYRLVWPELQPVPESWANQGLEFSADTFGIPQHKNGPCGVLAAVQAVVAAQAGDALSPTMVVSDQMLASALAAMISQCRPTDDAPCTLATWPAAALVANPNAAELAPDALAASLLENIGQFKAPGGCVLLMYSLVLTRTPDQVKKDLASEMESGPLVLAPTFVCSMGLMGLLLKGEARGTISAYAAIGGAPIDWPSALGVGMLSFSEVDSGQPVCNTLKSPSSAVWVMHGGDHFTVLFSTQDVTAEAPLELWHYNGLPPAGPRMCKVSFESKGVAGAAREGPREDTFLAPVPGQVEGVVQCNSEDKKQRPGQWTTWSYEVVLAVEDPDFSLYGQSARERTADEQPQLFELGEPPADGAWRCASCYRGRFKTMCFGQNEPGSQVCEYCDKTKVDAGWSMWLTFEQLPPGRKAAVTAQHAPKVYTLLSTKWPGCASSLTFASTPAGEGALDPPSV